MINYVSHSSSTSFVVFETDSTTALPLEEFLKNAFYCPSTGKKGNRLYALYGSLGSDPTSFTLCKAIAYVTNKPVYLRAGDKRYRITHSEIAPVSKISGAVPARTDDCPGPTIGKFASSHSTVWSALGKYKERAIIYWIEDYVERVFEDNDIKKAALKVLKRFQARTNKESRNSPASKIIEFLLANDICLCLWAYDKTLSSEQNYSRIDGMEDILSDSGYEGIELEYEDKPEFSFIFASTDTQDMEQFTTFLLSCSFAFNHQTGLYKTPDNRFYKVNASEPNKKILISKTLPINEKQLNELLAIAYGADCVLPEQGTFEYFYRLDGFSAVEKKACMIQSINKYGINAVKDILDNQRD